MYNIRTDITRLKSAQKILSPELSAQNSQPRTLSPELSAQNSQPRTLSPESSTKPIALEERVVMTLIVDSSMDVPSEDV
jgi:hypothetical protein